MNIAQIDLRLYHNGQLRKIDTITVDEVEPAMGRVIYAAVKLAAEQTVREVMDAQER